MSTRDPNAYFNFSLPATGEVVTGTVLHPRKARGAVASLFLGIASVPLVAYAIGFPLAVAGFICGINGLLAVKNGGGRIKGRGHAIAGVALCLAAFAGGVIWFSCFAKSAPEKQSLRSHPRTMPQTSPRRP